MWSIIRNFRNETDTLINSFEIKSKRLLCTPDVKRVVTTLTRKTAHNFLNKYTTRKLILKFKKNLLKMNLIHIG